MGTPSFDHFDAELAEVLRRADTAAAHGLTSYLGLRMVEVEPGIATAEVEVRPELLHQFGAVHGGVVAALVDHVLGATVFPVVPRGTWPATLEFKLNYLAAVRQGVIRATGRIVTLRRRTAVVQVDVSNDGQLVATSLGTISLNPPKQPT
jgi:1,4-dihydroxy-2-naphthoyl-CoA hydrolase